MGEEATNGQKKKVLNVVSLGGAKVELLPESVFSEMGGCFPYTPSKKNKRFEIDVKSKTIRNLLVFCYPRTLWRPQTPTLARLQRIG